MGNLPHTRPDWWDALLAVVDALPDATPPNNLGSLVGKALLPEWRDTGATEAVSFGLLLQLKEDDSGRPFPGVEFVLGMWRPYHDELTSHGPAEFVARFNDILWVGVKRWAAALAAVGAYLQAARSTATQEQRIPNAGHYILRAKAIAAQLNDDDLKATVQEAGLCLLRDDATSPFPRWVLAQAYAEDGGDVSRDVSEILDAFIAEESSQQSGCNWELVRRAMRVAATARLAIGEADRAEDLRLRAAQSHIGEGEAHESAGASSSLVADCYSRAVRALRDQGQKEAAEVVHRRLLEVQARIPGEMVTLRGEGIDLAEAARSSIAQVRGKPFCEQLVALCGLVTRSSQATYRELAEETAAQTPLLTMIPFHAVDSLGRTVKSPRDPIERLMLSLVDQNRQIQVTAIVEPVRKQIAFESPGNLTDWMEVLRDRPLADPDRLLALAKGLSAGLAGDWIVSASVLVPQLEFLVRKLLGEAEEITSTLGADGTQKEKVFSELLKKPRLTAILGEDWVFDLSSLLVEPGGNLRNVVAHGLLGDRQFGGVDSRYLWFVVIELLLKVRTEATAVEQ